MATSDSEPRLGYSILDSGSRPSRSCRNGRTGNDVVGSPAKVEGSTEMSGHSKWATTKHQKGAKDQKRAKIFAKLIRQVEVAAREGGGDINSNASLRTMFQKARDASVPIDTIERAVKRGTGELEGVRYEPVMYEGYAACGVAVIVECLTDNRNRSGSDVRSMFSKNGGSMSEPGSVAWQFERKGVVNVARDISEDDLMGVVLEAGAEDLRDEGDHWMILSLPTALTAVRSAVEQAGVAVLSGDVEMIPTTTIEVTSASDARKVLRLLEILEDHDDVQNVVANFDIPDEIFEAATA
jgi:YebC/PmpR family DNA-binding regulatory protein